MTHVVGQPLRIGTFPLRGKRNRPADLQNHLGNGLTQATEKLVELRQTLRALAVEFTHVDVENCGTGVETVDGLLDVLVHRQREVFCKIVRLPLRSVGSNGDDKLVLGFGEQWNRRGNA